MITKRCILICGFVALYLIGVSCVRDRQSAEHVPAVVPSAAKTWWKGNTHTHTLWSDGDAAPEKSAKWYKDHGYHFLVLSDHNVLSQGERWFEVKEKTRLTVARVEELRATFGPGWVEEKTDGGKRLMRLKNLPELRAHFEEPGRFLMIQGEEITDRFQGHEIHVNGLNIEELIPPQRGKSVRETVQRNIDAVIAQGKRLRRPVLAHLNHPNFRWSLTAEDLAAITGERFFEVYNGHPGVNNNGDAEHPDLDSMWDTALASRLHVLGLGLLYGLATDDTHHYFEQRVGRSNSGRGWIMVRAATLDAESIIAALNEGEFYSSSGVVIDDFAITDEEYRVDVAQVDGVEQEVRFIGTRITAGGIGRVGEVLAKTTGNPAVYRYRGDELYVRAKVISSRLHPNPHAEGDHECAWLQPVAVAKRMEKR